MLKNNRTKKKYLHLIYRELQFENMKYYSSLYEQANKGILTRLSRLWILIKNIIILICTEMP